MKKFTAIALVVLLLVMSVPFMAFAAPKWTEVKTAADFANMTDGNYWLTADIDLSKAAWTTIPEFSGTLNGNGHTVTVPADAPIIDKLSGTIKNVNLKGTMTLNDADSSTLWVKGAHDSYPLGVLANYAFGATVENVHSSVALTYNSGRTAQRDSQGTEVGGLIGIAMANFSLETNVVEGVETKTMKFNKNTTIKNVSNTGSMNLEFGKGMTENRDNLGGILGGALGGVDVSLALVSADITVANSKGNKGGIVGYVYAGYESKFTGASANFENYDIAVTLTDCLYNGNYALTGDMSERFAGIAGYAHNVIITNCVNEGSASGGSVSGILGYGNCNGSKDVHKAIITNSVAVGAKGCGTWTSVKCNTSGVLEYTNIPLLAENTLNGSAGSAPGAVETNVVKYEAKAEVRAAFLANGATNFEIKNDVLTLKMPTFTPEADPDFNAGSGEQGGNEGNVPTGDATTVLLVVSIVALAAVTVIVNVKRRITE